METKSSVTDLILGRRKFFLVFLFSVLFFLLSLPPVQAASIGLSLQPIKISHTIQPGEAVSGEIQITNVSEIAVMVETKIEDFTPLAGTYTIQFVGRALGLSTVRDWITLEPSEPAVFQKGETKTFKYTIGAPANAEPGGHFGVAFFKATKLAEKEAEQLRVGTQVGMLIFVTIPGSHLQKGKILDFTTPKFIQKGPVDFKIKFENTGTVHFEPKGAIKITNIFGREVVNIPVEGQVVLPTGVRDLTAQWNVGSFILGRYKAELSVKDGEGNVLTAESVTFYAFPVWYILGFIIAVIVLFFGLKFLRKKVKFSISIRPDESEGENQ